MNEDDEQFDFVPKEEKPIIAGIIDDRPNELKRRDIDWNRWRTLDPPEVVTGRPRIGSSEASSSRTTEADSSRTTEADSSRTTEASFFKNH